MPWKQIDSDQLRADDRVRIGDNTYRVDHVGSVGYRIEHADKFAWVSMLILTMFGAVFERYVEGRPDDAIPVDDGAVIRTGDASAIVAELDSTENVWRATSFDEYEPAELQQLADMHGFSVLWPQPKDSAVRQDRPTITNEMVDRATVEVHRRICGETSDWQSLSKLAKTYYRDCANAALDAAFGATVGDETEKLQDA